MMQQYHDAKEACGDALLLFRMGDFYELFHDDAKAAAAALGLTLTSRDKSKNPIPMAGFPFHQLDGYLAKLIRLGFRVAICEQVEDPKQAKGLVKREVTRIVTPGTLTDDELLDPKQSNFLAAVVHGKPLTKNGIALCGLSWAELSTGRFFAAAVPVDHIGDELARIAPSEILVDETDPVVVAGGYEDALITKRPSWVFGETEATDALRNQFDIKHLEGFGFESEDADALRAAGAILEYLLETQRASLAHIERLTPYRVGHCLEIDHATRRSLELTHTLRDGRRSGSLLGIIDRTVTSMGSRMLCDWMNAPLMQVDRINQRLDAVDELLDNFELSSDLRTELKEVYDLQRLLTRVTTGRASPRDLHCINTTLARLPRIKARTAARKCALLTELHGAIDLCPVLAERLSASLLDECPLTAREGGIIRSGVHPELDHLRSLATGGKEWIAKYQHSEQERTEISSLKVGFNKVFGFYIEVTNAHKDKVPLEYIRKQTLKNAERYITPELKEYEEKVLTAEDKSKEIEYQLFVELRGLVEQAAGRLRVTADALARLDVLAGLAELARTRGYCRPEIADQPESSIVDGRHPVLDVLEPDGTFVPNDTTAGPDGFILLITGPNMSGKSTYIRQVALLAIMAQMGSFVPAKSARLGVADRVFARVGASDELSKGQSTFMVEMVETARILNTATQNSLVILDEIGRGTSTYDGVSLAWSIVEYIHDQLQCRTLFATHYHELTQLADSHAGVVNLNVQVKEWRNKVVFLHKIVAGSADKSYGIHVAQLAGVPNLVTERATEILTVLEAQSVAQDASELTIPAKTKPTEFQLTLFQTEEHPIVEEVRQIRIDEVAPLDALLKIREWQDKV